MPVFDSATRTKINALRALRAAGTVPGIYETVLISWPDDATYYSVLPLDELTVPPPVSPIDLRLIPPGWPEHFAPVTIDSSIGDEELDLTFADQDGAFSDLLELHGEGSKVELFYWFPDVELLLPIWLGHLRVEDEADVDRVKVKAVNGFRSADATAPHRGHWQECQAIFGALLATQAEIDENDCGYNRHIGGAVGNLNGAVPYTSCPRRTRQQCIDRMSSLGNWMLSHQTIQTTLANNQTSGNRLYSTSAGNETNLEEPVRVVMGTRRVFSMKVMVDRRDLNNNNPEHGWYVALYEACEGPIQSFSQTRITVGGQTQNANLQHYGQRLGTKAQGTIDTGMTAHGYSGTAHIRYAFGWIDPRTVDTAQASATSMVVGLNNIRVYSDATTYAQIYTASRAWQIARLMTDNRWGYGLDYARFNIDSWIAAAAWLDVHVRHTDPEGTNWDHQRDSCHVELIERKTQEQIEGMCLAGRLSRPFVFDGKIHIEPLRALTTEELEAAPVFTDEGEDRNIIWEESDGVMKSTLRRSRKSDATLINRIECTFDDATKDYTKQPAPPAEDIDYQLAAGRIVGDMTKKVNPKKYHLMGVVNKAQAIKLSFGLLDLGEFDEGGLMNNLRLKFKIWCIDALDLHPAKVIKVTSSQITRYGFEYFRVIEMNRDSDLSVEITAQAYNVEYMNAFEVTLSTLPGPPPVPPGPEPPGPTPVPCVLEFGTITYQDGSLNIPVPPC